MKEPVFLLLILPTLLLLLLTQLPSIPAFAAHPANTRVLVAIPVLTTSYPPNHLFISRIARKDHNDQSIPSGWVRNGHIFVAEQALQNVIQQSLPIHNAWRSTLN